MPYSNYLDTQLNKEAFGGTGYSPPATVYVGLSTTNPTKAGTNITQPSGGYARVAVTNNTTNWVPSSSQPSSGQQQENGTVITFPTATSDWGTVTHFVVYDASTGGNFLAYGALDTSRNVLSGDTAKFAAGALKIKLD